MILALWLFLQETPPAEPPTLRRRGDELRVGLGGTVALESHSNVFHLSRKAIAILDEKRPAEQQSGRFRDIEAADDAIVTAEAGVRMRATTDEDTLTLALRAGYDLYTTNPERSHERYRFDAARPLFAGSRLELRADYVPDFFRNNYLSGVTDPIGPVDAGERRYSRASYSETSTDLLFDLAFSTEPTATHVILGARRWRQNYDDAFPARDIESGGYVLGFEWFDAPNDSFLLLYTRDSVRGTVAGEWMILDEDDYGVNFNSDLDATDQDVGTFQNADRSRAESSFRLEWRWPDGDVLRWRFFYELRLRDYRSSEPFDRDHVGRVDTRNRFALEARIRASAKVSVNIAAELARQSKRGPGDQPILDEAEDYTYTRFAVEVVYRF